MASQLPAKYRIFNDADTKNLVVVVAIEGAPDLLSFSNVYKRIRYGDPDVKYGGAGLVYGGLIPIKGTKALIDLDGSSLTLSQTIEPEQGRGSISQLSVAFLDQNNYMTELVSPGVVLDEILGRRVKVFIGYKQISYPEDFVRIFRGRITAVTAQAKRVILQFSDPNIIGRQQVFFAATTTTTGAINNSVTTIPVASTGDFHKRILGPNGAYDSAVKTFIKIDDEFIETTSATFTGTSFVGVTRGARGTTAAAHDSGSTVDSSVELTDNAMDMALKIRLSGWNGNFLTGVTLQNIVYSGDPSIGDLPNAIVLPNTVDAVEDLGLAVGDYFTITGDSHPANNVSGRFTRFGALGDLPNRVIYTDQAGLVHSVSTAGVMAVRSQYDTYPVSCGIKANPDEVDVERHQYLKQTFLGGEELRFLLTDPESAKTFIESQIYLPAVCYSLTRFGRMSVGMTLPPIADQRLQVIDHDSVIDPGNIVVTRAVNNRKFFNDISWEYDFDDSGNAQSVIRTLDTDSVSKIQIASSLPISTRGTHTDIGAVQKITNRNKYLLSRYKRGALQIPLSVNYGMANLIEAGDVIALDDSGNLKIANLETGARDIGVQLFEVIGRNIDFKQGRGSLTLLSGLNFGIQDKFATWAPSSKLAATGSTTTRIKITASYGAIFGDDEYRKWQDYLGLRVKVHNYDFTQSAVRTLTSLDSSNPNILILDSALPFTPGPTHIVDLDDYPDSTDTEDQKFAKLVHIFWTKTGSVSSGTSQTVFDVSSADLPYLFVGNPLIVRSATWSSISPEVKITAIVGTQITVDTALGFTPAAGYKTELLAFKDGGQPYRWV